MTEVWIKNNGSTKIDVVNIFIVPDEMILGTSPRTGKKLSRPNMPDMTFVPAKKNDPLRLILS